MRVRTPPQRRGREPPKGTLAGPPNREDATGPIGLSSREFGRDLLGREDDRFKQAGTAVMARELQYAGRLQTGHRPSVLIRWAVRSEAHGLGSSGCGGGRGGLGWSEELVIYVGFARDAKSLEHLGVRLEDLRKTDGWRREPTEQRLPHVEGESGLLGAEPEELLVLQELAQLLQLAR